jgi:hypothetical protein
MRRGRLPVSRRMFACTVKDVTDEWTLSALADLPERHHGVRAQHMKPCLPRTYQRA